MLYPDGAEDQKFWVSRARNAFMAFTLYLFENWDDERSSGFPGAPARPRSARCTGCPPATGPT